MPDPRLDALETLRHRFCLDAARPGTDESREDPAAIAARLGPDGTWPDIDYANNLLKDWTTVEHLRRLLAIAQGWHRPGVPAAGQAPIPAALLRGLDGWYACDPVNPNWWWNQIGAPLLLGRTLLHLKGACPPSFIERAVPALCRHEPIHRFTGQNLVWTATVLLIHGILTDDPERASQAFLLIGRETRVLPGEEGIQPDMSFHQHGSLLYSGGYGQDFAADVAFLIALADGTAYAWPAPLIDRFARFLLDGSRWMVRGRSFDPGTNGRAISRLGQSASGFFAGLRHLAAVRHTRQAETRASAAADPAAGRSLVEGNRHFWCSDLMTHHHPDWYASVRVPSPRVWNNDIACCGGEGRICHHMADGAVFLMRDGDDYRDLYPVWNWRQIPGTTTVQQPGPFAPDALRVRGERAFAGGASDGSIGCMAVDFSRPGVTARKAWFLFDDGLVALGADLTATVDEPVRTTLNQCLWRGPAFLAGRVAPLPEGVYPIEPGTAFWHDGFGYSVLDGGGTLRLGPQTGAWSDCGVGSPEPLTWMVLNAGLHHGIRPAGASYAYAVWPAAAPDSAFAAESDRFVILRNEEGCQAVWHAGTQLGQAAFFQPGSVAFPDGLDVASDRPCILLYRPQPGGGLVLTLAQPAHEEGLLTLRLTGRRSVALGVSLPVGEYAGSSVSLTVH